MIKCIDAFTLALTKLRARKVRTIVTTILASLLFGVLIAGSLIVNGLFDSVGNFSRDGLTNRYIVSVNNAVVNTASTSVLRDPNLITQAKERYAELVKEKTVEAKRLGLAYSQINDQPPYTEGSDGIERLSLNDKNGITQALLAEKFGNKASIDDAKLKLRAAQYRATEVFTVENLYIKRGATLNVLSKGKEVFYDASDDSELNANYTLPVIDSTFPIAPSNLTAPFMLPNNAGWTADSNSLPIVIPQNVAEQLLDLITPTSTATASQKLEHIKQVRSKATDFTFRACYRNDASISLIQQTVVQQKEIKSQTGRKDYKTPSLIYGLPDDTKCANPTVVNDTRTVEQKKKDENQKAFDQTFGFYNEPESYFVTFKIVGISPAQSTDTEQNRNTGDVVNNLLKTSGVGQLIPEDLYEQIPDKSKYTDILKYEPSFILGSEDNKTRYVEFSSAADAQKFIDEQSCTTQMDGTCKPVGRDYIVRLAFSESIALNDIRSKVAEWFAVAVIGAIFLAAIIMWITIGRTVADGRRETAVFRAIGFKRIDVSLVYIIYTVILSLLTTILSGVIGFVGAYLVNEMYSPELTAQAQYAFGGLDLTKEIILINVNYEQLGIIAIACLATGLLSVIIPLLRNVRRSPIEDMRDDG